MMSYYQILLFVVCVRCVFSVVSPISYENNEFSHMRHKRDAPSSNERESCQPFSVQPATRKNTTDKLYKLRERMIENNYSAYIIPSDDEHQSEYVAKNDERRTYISGFTGSAGTAVVLLDSAALWTDGRYFLQAEDELDCNWILMKSGEKDTPIIKDWINENLSNGSKVAADPRLISKKLWLDWENALSLAGISLVEDYKNLVDEIWIEKLYSSEPIERIFIHDIIYAGKSWEDKIDDVRNELIDAGADSIVVTALDEVAWLFNLRGSDIPYNPVFKSFAFVSLKDIRIYVDPIKLTHEVRQHLTKEINSTYVVQLKNYTDVYEDIKNVVIDVNKVLISSRSSYAIYSLIPKEKRIVKESPVYLMKCVKNSVEIEGMKKAHIKDSVAIIDFISMLEEEVKAGKHWDEIKAKETLEEYRKQQKLNMGESFGAISAFGPNGAVIHYSPKPETNLTIDTKNLYLLDTGGQYLDGTTDTTRTFHFGRPADYEKEVYTRVLKGVIDLASAIFPESVRDIDLDIFARRHLYEVGLNYLHGTGHGIGSFLSVHEGPIYFRDPALKSSGYKLKPGMFISDEPGYYEAGKFGIRLETIVTVVEANTPYNFNNLTHYTFEPIALVPFEPKLIKTNLLTKFQLTWLNEYHQMVRKVIGEELHRQKKTRAFDWMMLKTNYLEPVTCGR